MKLETRVRFEQEVANLFRVFDTKRMRETVSKPSRVPLRCFTRAEPFLGMFLREEVFDDPNEGQFLSGVTPSDVDFHWDQTIIKAAHGENMLMGFTHQLHRSRSLRVVDGAVEAETTFALIHIKGWYITLKSFARWKNGVWKIVHAEGCRDVREPWELKVNPRAWGTEGDIEERSLDAHLSVYFSRAYHWQVIVEKPAVMSMSFATSPQGAAEAFASRDRKGRDSLLHWVSSHWKKTKAGDDAEVRSHVRGQEQFRWGEFNCTIISSRADLSVLSELKTRKSKSVMSLSETAGMLV